MKKRKQVYKAVCIILILVLLALAGGFGYVWSKLNLIQYDSRTDRQSETELTSAAAPADASPEGAAPEDIVPEDDASETVVLSEADVADLPMAATAPEIPEGEIWSDSDVLNILLIGTDERSTHFSDNARSDSMILVSLGKRNKTIKMVSFERGTGVPVLAGVYKGQYDWLTHMFRYGGADLLIRTIQECFQVKIDHYVRVNFNTVRQTVDSIGGVDIELTQAEADYLNMPGSSVDSGDLMPVTAGTNHLDGTTALAFARTRKIDSDWRRVERQRKVIAACLAQLKQMSFSEMNRAADQILPLIQTDFSKMEIAELLVTAPGFFSSQIDQMTIPKAGTYGAMKGMGNRSLYAVNFSQNAKILREFLYPN